MLAGGRNSRCNSLDYFLSSFFLCVSFYLVRPPPTGVGCFTRQANEGTLAARALSLLVSALHARGSSAHAASSVLCPVASFSRSRAAQQLDCSILGADQHTPRACAKAVHTLAALLRRRSPAPIRSAYAARIRCSSPATAAMAKSRSRLSRCSFTDYAPYDRRRSTAGCAGANFHREVHQCEHWYSGSDACWYCNSRESGGKVVCGSAHAAAREACTKYRPGHVARPLPYTHTH